MHYYNHHIGDFLKATSRLTDAQSMAYLRLLWMYYDSEKPLPDQLDTLAFQVGVDENTVRLILQSFFKNEGGAWRHTRCDKEIAEYQQLIHKRSNAGRASAQRKLNTCPTPVEQVLNTEPTDVQLTNNQEPITINHKPIKEKAARGTRLSPDFVLPDEWVEFCKQQRPDLIPREVFDSFRDYWIAQPGQKAVKLDWAATWRQWVRNTRVSTNTNKPKADRKSALIFGDSWNANVIDMEDADGQPVRIR